MVAYWNLWQKHPPVDILAAAYLKYKPGSPQQTIENLAGVPGVNVRSAQDG